LDSKVFRRSGDNLSTGLKKLLVTQPGQVLAVITTKDQVGPLKPILADHLLLSTMEEVLSKSLGTTTTVLSPRLSLVIPKPSWRTQIEFLRKDGSPLSVLSGSTPLLRHLSHQCMMLSQVSGNPTLLTQLLVLPLVSELPSTLSTVVSNVADGPRPLPTVLLITRVLWDTSTWKSQLVSRLHALPRTPSHQMDLVQFPLTGIKTGLATSASLSTGRHPSVSG